ncbi:MAG: histidine kinase [Cyclobacteriaceae bacterium]
MSIGSKLDLSLKKELKESVYIFLFGGVFMTLLWCTRCWDDMYLMTINISYSGLFWLLLWKGSQYMVAFLDSIYSWLEYPIKRTILSVASICVYTVLVVFLLDISFDMLVLGKTFDQSITNGLNGTPLTTTILITLGINTFMHGRGFLIEWRQMSIDVEKLKTEQVSTQYESLRNQVNPHFLFNSLNALTSLVYDDQDKAVEFIRKLSQVYRYVLDKKDEEVVPIEDEINFMENFIFLQKIRFGDNLKMEVRVDRKEGYLPPLALQILVENAIKHNVISEKDPLKIRVEITPEYCLVENSIKEKLVKDSTGIGLNNLKARYNYLSNEEIEITANEKEFKVKLPILKLDR